jgi:hypothetical protein
VEEQDNHSLHLVFTMERLLVHARALDLVSWAHELGTGNESEGTVTGLPCAQWEKMLT